MYEWGLRKQKGHGVEPCPNTKVRLFLLVATLGRCSLALNLSLGLSFFHGLLGFGGALGTGLGALFLLLVENFLAAEQFEKSLVGAITLIPMGADDPGVSAFAITEAGSDRVEQLHQRLVRHQIGAR